MADIIQPPLTYQTSDSASHPHISSSLPPEVIQCLRNARFLHLATCDSSVPHVSLMNYTYLPSTPFQPRPHPTIIMTTNPASKKTHNLLSNPRVSLLVHDWVSHRPPTAATAREGSPPRHAPPQSSLAALLLNMNTSALSRISTTINGEARIVPGGSDEEKWCKEAHLRNNTFGEEGPDPSILGSSPGAARAGVGMHQQGDGGRGCFIEGEEVMVVVVGIRDGRIADWKGGVQDWAIEGGGGGGDVVVNGV